MQRKNYIDIAKGIGIILVILGHLVVEGIISRSFIYSFHMPLFYFISGMFAHTQGIDFKTYFKKTFKGLMVPFWIFCFIDLLGNLIMMLFYDKQLPKNYILGFIGIDFQMNNIPIWFLLSLFIIKIAYYFISKKKILEILAILSGLGTMIASYYCKLPSKNIIVASIPCMIFYILGNKCKNTIFNIEKTINDNKCTYGILTIILFITLIVTSNINSCIDLRLYKYGNLALLFINAFIGITIILFSSAFIQNNGKLSSILSFYGRNTLIIIPLHYFFCRILLPIILGVIKLDQYLYHPITQIVVCLILLLAFIPIIKINNKYFPFIYGKTKRCIK